MTPNTRPKTDTRPAAQREAGFSLMELMIAMTIGLLLLTGLAMIFVNTSDANRELQKTAQQIENGRYATDILSQDLRIAGFFGHIADFGDIAAPSPSPPDPCNSTDAAQLLSAIRFPVQAYKGAIGASPAADTAAAGLTTACSAILTSANLKAGSDVLVVRRADTNALTATSNTVAGAFYIQASSNKAEIQPGAGAPLGSCPTAAEHCKADGTTASTLKLSNGASPAPSAPIRRLRVHVYFVAPCSVGTGTAGGVAGACAPGDDTIPTLKRLELDTSGNFTLVPLVEGIEYFKVEFGLDHTPSATNPATGSVGDANVDQYVASPAATDWPNVVAAKLYLLARNTEPTQGFLDDKIYALGSTAVPARNDRFRRHVYSAAVQLTNPLGRREVP